MSVSVLLQPCRQCGQPRDERSPDHGRYAKLCADCRQEKAAGIRAANASGKRPPAAPTSHVNLPKVVQAAVAPAKRFQKAVETRHSARLEAQAALLELNSALRGIQEAAQKLMNGHQSNARVEAELAGDEDAT